MKESIPEQTPPPPIHFHPKIWLPILAAVLAVAGYLIWANTHQQWPFLHDSDQRLANGEEQNETANWKTYRNEEYGFEVKYSGDYKLQTEPLDDQGTWVQGYFAFQEEDWDDILAVISISNPKAKYPNTDLDRAFFAATVKPKSDCPRTQNLTGTVNIGGTDFFVSDAGGAGLGHQAGITKYSAVINGNCFTLLEAIYTSGYGGIEGIEQVNFSSVSNDIYQILSTFKFTDKRLMNLTEKPNLSFKLEKNSCKPDGNYSKFSVLKDSKKIGEISSDYCESTKVEILFVDNKDAYFSVLPGGLGGYILYGKYDSLFHLDFASNVIKKTEVGNSGYLTDIDFTAGGGKYVYSDNEKIIVQDTITNQKKTYILPEEGEDAQKGSYKFSPNGGKVAIAFGFGPDNGHGKIYILNLNDGNYSLFKATSLPPHIDEWKNDDEPMWH